MKKQAGVFLLMAALTALYFLPSLLGGYVLAPGDGAALNYPKRAIARMIAPDSPLQLWNPYLFSGFPFMGSIESAAYYPPNWLALVLPLPLAFNLIVMLHYAMAAYFAFLYARALGAEDFAALCAGGVYAFMGFTAAHLQHMTILTAAPWLPLLLYLTERLRLTLDRRYAFGIALAFALFILAGHPQTLFNAMLVLGTALLYYALGMDRDGRVRFLVLAALGFVLGTAIASPQLLATYELTRMSPRADVAYKYFTSFSFPPHLTAGVFFPFLFGKGYGGRYWGPFKDTTLMEGYVGALVAVTALLYVLWAWRRDRHAPLLGLIAAAGFVLALGGYTPLYEVLYRLPFFSYFRASSRHWLEVDLALSVLFALGVTHMARDGEARRKLAAWGLIALAVVMVSALALTTFLKGPLMGLISARLGVMSPEGMSAALSPRHPAIYVPLFLMLGYAAWLLLMRLGVRPGVTKYFLALLLVLDALSFKTEFGHGLSPSRVSEVCGSGVFRFLAERTALDGARVAFLHERMKPLQGAQCGLRMVDGYEQLAVASYNSLLGIDTRGAYESYEETATANLVLGMLGARYLVISPGMEPLVSNIRARGTAPQGSGLAYRPPFRYAPDQAGGFDAPLYSRVYADQSALVYENPNALPPAFAVSSVSSLSPAETLGEHISSHPFDPSREALIADHDLIGLKRKVFALGEVSVLRRLPGGTDLRTEFPSGGFVVVSEQYYPGWHAAVDGLRVPLYRVNGVLMGAPVPPGAHILSVAYRPRLIYFTMALAALVLTATLAALIRSARPKR